MIDRIAPTQRPDSPVQGYQRWRSLLFLHWEVPVETLRPLVPQALSLDLYEGRAYVGVVPFAMQGVRPKWLPEICALRFLETNVRTYVHLDGLPGVYFFSLDADSRSAVMAARTCWGLPYYFAQMRMIQNGNEIRYETRRTSSRASHHVRYRLGDSIIGPSAPGTVEHFLLERYVLFVERGGRLFAGRVHHQPYPVQTASVLEVEDNLIAAAGMPQPREAPAFVHYAAAVDVEIFSLQLTTSRGA